MIECNCNCLDPHCGLLDCCCIQLRFVRCWSSSQWGSQMWGYFEIGQTLEISRLFNKSIPLVMLQDQEKGSFGKTAREESQLLVTQRGWIWTRVKTLNLLIITTRTRSIEHWMVKRLNFKTRIYWWSLSGRAREGDRRKLAQFLKTSRIVTISSCQKTLPRSLKF